MKLLPIEETYRKNLATIGLASILLVTSVSLHANSSTVIEQKKQLFNLINSVSTTWSDRDFSARVLSADTSKISIGSSVSYRFQSNHDCYVTLIQLDSLGELSISKPWGGQKLLAGAPRRYPKLESSEKIQMQAPTGKYNFAAFCSNIELRISSMPNRRDTVKSEGTDAINILTEMVSSLRDENISFGRQIWQQTAVRRNNNQQYNQQDVIAFFEIKTRSLKPRKLPLEINFAHNSAQLSRQSRSSLDVIAKALLSKNLLESQFRLAGHADATGTDTYNQKLSQQRALATRLYLTTNYDIDIRRLGISAHGETLPIADNTNSEGRAENRRVELIKLK